MKKRNARFIILNIISTLIEYSIIFLVFYFLFKFSLSKSLLTTLIIFVIFIFITIFALIGIQKPKKNNNKETSFKEFEKYSQIVDEANKKYNMKLKVIYEDIPQPNPAFAIGRTIYINTKFSVPSDLSCGVIAHEVGHSISGLSRLTPIASLRVSTIFCNLFRILVSTLCSSDNIINKILSYFFYVLYIIFSLGNFIVLYPFMKEDELIANKYACELGYGLELRVYYAQFINKDEPVLFRKVDTLHPTATYMNELLTQDLKLKGIEKSLYYCNNHLYYSFISTYTLNLDNISVLMSCSLMSSKLKKLKSNSLIEIKRNVLEFLPNLVELNCPSLEKLQVSELAKLNNLKKIIVKNEEIYLQILKCGYLKDKPFYAEIEQKYQKVLE